MIEKPVTLPQWGVSPIAAAMPAWHDMLQIEQQMRLIASMGMPPHLLTRCGSNYYGCRALAVIAEDREAD